MSDEPVPPEPTSDAVELLGWLELPLDDTQAAIVTSFNEGFVPTSLNSDLFLPNGLRRRLGLNDNARRYARCVRRDLVATDPTRGRVVGRSS